MCGYDPSILHDNIYCDNDEETIKHLNHTLYNSCLSKLNPKNYDDFSSLVLVSTARSLNIMIERTKEFIPNHQLQKKSPSVNRIDCQWEVLVAISLKKLQPNYFTCNQNYGHVAMDGWNGPSFLLVHIFNASREHP
jgi:hypothetical protein